MTHIGWHHLLVCAALLAALFLAGCERRETPPPATTAQAPTTEKAPAPPSAPPAAQSESDAVAAARKLGTPTTNPAVKTPSGLEYIDVKTGDGAPAQAGQTVTVHYTGWLVNGQKFDSSLDRNQPFAFSLGARQVIPGWDEGVAGMKPNGVRKLIVPPALGYGSRGVGPIPANSTLIFEVQLLKAQ
ncbi:MAG: FKBP-type peptidyl-prolyl cis-trans isomerase [Armatimonadota bacterium]|jgi:peptidylprolyl isomerase